jgi:hypothetical protein
MRRAVRSLAALAGLAILAIVRAASAGPVELDWRAPPGCSSRSQVLDEIERLVAKLPAEPLHARAVVTRHARQLRVTIELAGAAEGLRTLQARSCESVARATALIIALAVDPQAAAVATEPRTELPGGRPPESDRDAPRGPPTAPPLRGVALLGLLGERALVPGMALGAEAGAGIRWRFARADMTLGVLPSASTDLPNRLDVRGDFTLGFLALRACAGLVDDSASALGCATLRGSRIWGRGAGQIETFERTAHVLSFEPGLLLRAPGRDGLATELGVNLVVPLRRPRFVIEDDGVTYDLFQPAGLGAVVKLAVGYEF